MTKCIKTFADRLRININIKVNKLWKIFWIKTFADRLWAFCLLLLHRGGHREEGHGGWIFIMIIILRIFYHYFEDFQGFINVSIFYLNSEKPATPWLRHIRKWTIVMFQCFNFDLVIYDDIRNTGRQTRDKTVDPTRTQQRDVSMLSISNVQCSLSPMFNLLSHH